MTSLVYYYRYFENYKNEGEFLDLDLLDPLGDTILLNERLMFLGEKLKLCQKGGGGDHTASVNLTLTLGCVP